MRGVLVSCLLALLLLSTHAFGTSADAPASNAILIGLDADMSSGSAKAGEAIRRGIVLAMNEINQAGGVLGRPLELVVRDHRGNPARGADNIEAFAQHPNLVAVVGGLHTPVILNELDMIHRHRMVFLVPWAAGTSIIANGRDPNYVFRVSVRDEYAGEFLIREALRRGYRRPGLLLERTGWGRSNERGMTAALRSRGLAPVGPQWFHWGIKNMAGQLTALTAAGADVIMLVGNAPEGTVAIKAMSALPSAQRVPIMAHWGITGGNFFPRTQASLAQVDLVFLQTFSFLEPPFPHRAKRVLDAYCATFPSCDSPRSVFAPVGTAHAYDLIHLLRLAIERAGTIDRASVRDALEQIERYAGLVRTYESPFAPHHHDALDASDFRLARYDEDGTIVPLRSGKGEAGSAGRTR